MHFSPGLDRLGRGALGALLILAHVAAPIVQAQPTAAQRLPPPRVAALRSTDFAANPALPASLLWDADEHGAGQSPEVSVVLELADEPLGTMRTRLLQDAEAEPLQRPAAEQATNAALRMQLTRVEAAQAAVVAQLSAMSLKPLFRLQRAYNGIAVRVQPRQIADLAQLPGVVHVRRIQSQSLHNTSSVRLIGAPAAWSGVAGLTGKGIKIGIIDTGIDYRHATFGSISGTFAISNNTTVITDNAGFPGARVVGGFDFAGDRYAANGFGTASEPSPDPDPADCNGHGTHVAGTAAGSGVLHSGMPYTGGFNTPLDWSAFRIGPGVAPEAQLYALKVFGCFGTTDLTDAAIEWAMDPDKDGDFSDRLDVINLSLGSSFGMPDDPSARAANAAAAAGVIVVASAGNSGDTHFIHGSPATADRAIAVAGSDDGHSVMDALVIATASGITESFPALQSAFYVYSPTVGAISMALRYPISDTTGCGTFTLTDTVVISGAIVLLDWSHKGDANECGSGTRLQNAYAAGAKGVVLAYDLPNLDITIGGSRDIPSVIVPKASGDDLRTRLRAGTVLTAIFDASLNGTRVLTNAAVVDASYQDSSRGVRMRDSAPKPDLAAPAVSIFSARNGSGGEGVSFNGTSMAAPHVSGQMALLRQRHPFWSVEELKALAMNTAQHDVMYVPNITSTTMVTPQRHGPQRVGAGRIDVSTALAAGVVAYNDGGNGRVSLGFGALEATTLVTRTRSLRLSNKTMISRTLTLSYDAYTHAPGAVVAVSQASVTLDAFSDARVAVTLTFDPAQFQRARDASLRPTQGELAREWTTDETGIVLVADSASGQALRVPLHASLRPLGSTHSDGSTRTQSILTISGMGVQGPGIPPTAAVSHATALELGYHAPAPFERDGTEYAQIRAVGAASDYAAGHGILSTTLYFGIGSHGNWSTPSAQHAEFDVYIDTNNDNIADFVLFNFNHAAASGQLASNDVFVGALLNYKTFGRFVQTYTNGIAPDSLNLPLFNNSVMVLPVRARDLGLFSGRTIQYQVVSYARESATAVDASPVIRFDPTRPAFDLTGGRAGPPLWRSLAGDHVPVKFNGGPIFVSEPFSSTKGILLLHHLNDFANRVEVITRTPEIYYFPMIRQNR